MTYNIPSLYIFTFPPQFLHRSNCRMFSPQKRVCLFLGEIVAVCARSEEPINLIQTCSLSLDSTAFAPGQTVPAQQGLLQLRENQHKTNPYLPFITPMLKLKFLFYLVSSFLPINGLCGCAKAESSAVSVSRECGGHAELNLCVIRGKGCLS